jgi:hypothetical protein
MHLGFMSSGFGFFRAWSILLFYGVLFFLVVYLGGCAIDLLHTIYMAGVYD